MIKLDDIRLVYLIGIGGIGMSALARYFRSKGLTVAGYDRTPTALTKELEDEDIAVHYDDNIKLIPDVFLQEKIKNYVLVIYTPAVPKDHLELNYFKNHNYDVLKRSEVLGMLTKGSQSIAVAGTHGKTSTSSMIAHVLKFTGYDCNAFLGGITTNYNSNLLLSDSSNTTVVEADEYDRSFLHLYPDIAIITSLDPDHLDIYGNKDEIQNTYREFASQIKPNGLLVCKKGLEINAKVKTITYSTTEKADVQAKNIRIENGTYLFDVDSSKGKINNIRLQFAGSHNVENALAVIAVAQALKLDTDDLRNALASFKGVKRRFETILKTNRVIYIDDYAHHPTEIKACIKSIREIYPDKKITGIFQPHLFSRTRDFADDFAKTLESLDEIILLDIYPARELPIEGIDSSFLLNLIHSDNKKLMSKTELLENIKLIKPELLLTIGAGDIDKLVDPIKNELIALN